LTIRFLFAYAVPMPEERERGALLIAACLIAAIRLRGEPIKPSPKLKSTIYDSVQLAVLVWREIQGHRSTPLN
jgi:hypothetical protein